MEIKSLTVEGMACPNCVRHLSEALTEAGVRVLSVDLNTGIVRISGDKPLSDDALQSIVEEAGYSLVKVE